MNLRIIAMISIAIPLIGFTSQLEAQLSQDSFEIAFQVRETNRRAVISNAMRFSDEESIKFWPRYDDYRSQVKKFQLRRLAMLREVSSSMVGMTDKKAHQIVTAALKLEQEQQKAKNRFVHGLRSNLQSARYFRYYQLETKLDAMFTYGWTKHIPLTMTEDEADILQKELLEMGKELELKNDTST